VGQKKQIKDLEEQNRSLVDKNKQIEEEYRKVLAFRTLMDSYKDQVAALETNNQDLIRENRRLDYDMKHLAAKVEGLETERMGYTDHIQSLEDRVREMEFGGVGGLDPFFQPRSSVNNNGGDDDDDDMLGDNLEDAFNEANPTTLKLKINNLERQIKTLQEEKEDSTGGQRAVALQFLLDEANRLKKKVEQDWLMAASERDMLEADMKRIKEGIPAALQDTSKPTMALRAHIIDLEKETASLRERIVEMENKVQAGIGATATAASSVPGASLGRSEHPSLSELREQNRQQAEQIKKLLLEKNHMLTQQIEDKNRVEKERNINSQLMVGNESHIQLKEENAKLHEEIARLQEQHKQMHDKMQKAKEFIKQQDKLFKETKANTPKDNGSEEAITSLKAEVKSKEMEIERLMKQIHDIKLRARRELQLMSSAWHDINQQVQRHGNTKQQRAQPTSWLAQQRLTLGQSKRQ